MIVLLSVGKSSMRAGRRGRVLSLVLGSSFCFLFVTSGLWAARADSPQPGQHWLEVLNFYRSSAKLHPVIEDPTLTQNAALHARYIVQSGLYEHYEDPHNSAYTTEGNDAGQHSEILSSTAPMNERQAIENWITAPFHAFGLLRPKLEAAGFGSFSKPDGHPYAYAAALDVRHDQFPETPASIGFPVRWPGPSTTVPFVPIRAASVRIH
jgi:uncharacterized protein YkwD